jgi:ABC-type nitrate/sulfonate/bicarbonate transport system substrate-binding protein
LARENLPLLLRKQESITTGLWNMAPGLRADDSHMGEKSMSHACFQFRARLASIGLCVLVAVALLDARTASAGKIKVVFPGPTTTFSLPHLVAQKKGWLGDLEIEDVHVTGDANAMRALLSGNADLGLVGTLNVLASIHAGAAIRAIFSWQPIGDYNLVLAAGKGTKLEDLAGKTFASSGPGGLPDQLPRLVMRKHGIDEASTRFVQVGGHAARLQAVIGGRADATLINTVTALKGVQDGKVTVLTKVSAEFPGLGYFWNVVRTESLNKPELAAAFQAMTDGCIRGSRFVMENPDEAAAILHERVPDLNLAFLKAVVRDLNSENLWGVDGGLDPAVQQFTADLNMKLGNLPVAAAAKDVLDSRFVDAALKKLGSYRKQ